MCLYMFIHIHAYVCIFKCINRSTYTYSHVYICTISLSAYVLKATSSHRQCQGITRLFWAIILSIFVSSFLDCGDPGSHRPTCSSFTVPRFRVTNIWLVTAGTSRGVAPPAPVTPRCQWMIVPFSHSLGALSDICRCSCRLSLITPLTWPMLSFSCWAAKDEGVSLFRWGL